ncbi:OmpA family protein [Croceitalea marina]|uniref:OmpA family protein n=1 Tax=Croceitalea marina TaxID=1775166 RepID=A0ABW5MZH4_9FLAO
MKTTRLTLLVITLLLSVTVFSQEYTITEKDSIVTGSWIFGVGFNVVDDAGSEFTDIFNVKDNWNFVPFPSRLSIGRYFKNGLGLEAIGSYNRYKEGKTIDGDILSENINYYALDFRASYDLNKIIGETGFFDPYVGLGIGYTDANNVGRGTYNASVGFRAWFNDRIGLDFNSTGKWAMSTEGATNHIQHAAGLVYQFGIEKGLSRKGEEKLAQLQELEKEQQRVQDSIDSAQRAEQEAKELAQLLKREAEEAAKLKADDKNKENTEKLANAKIAKEIAALGNVYFDLNSSYLSSEDKQILEKLIIILNENPEIKIQISAHTDSRGTHKYNKWLSEKRAKRSVKYLTTRGISEGRIITKAFGETELLNDCDDNIACPEKKHSENRRSAFQITRESFNAINR